MKTIDHIISILLFIAIITLTNTALCQSPAFNILKIDESAFPKIKADFILAQPDGSPYSDLKLSEFSLKENGNPMNLWGLNCINNELEKELEILIMVDKSSSMLNSENPELGTRWEWVTESIRTFIDSIRIVERTQIAITTFNNTCYLVCPFTNNKARLKDSLKEVRPGGGTDYNPPFLDWRSGAYVLLEPKPADVKRIAIFITDGEPTVPSKKDSIIHLMRLANILVFCITVQMPMNNDLRDISDATGGKTFVVNTLEEFRNLSIDLAKELQAIQHCSLTWETDYGCDEASRNRKVELEFSRPTTPLTKELSYISPENSIAKIGIKNPIYFGDIPANSSIEKMVDFEALNTKANVVKIYIKPADKFVISDFGGQAPPFLVDVGSKWTLKVKFMQGDEQIKEEAKLCIVTTRCTTCVDLTAGPGKISIDNPIGNTKYSICDTIIIKWSGIDTTTKVDLLYSNDSGNAWDFIVQNVTGNEYRWIAPAVGEFYRIKAVESANASEVMTGTFSVLLPDIVITEPEINFGDCQVDNKKIITKEILNIGEVQTKILSTSIKGDNTEEFVLKSALVNQIIQPKNSINIDIEFTPITEGFKSAILAVDFGCEITETISLQGNGTKPVAVYEGFGDYNIIFSIVPNPFNDVFMLYFVNNYSTAVQIDVLDCIGEKVLSINRDIPTQSNYSEQIDATGLPPGLYFYRVITDKEVLTGRMVKAE